MGSNDDGSEKPPFRKTHNNDIENIRQINSILVLNALRVSGRLLSRPILSELLFLSKVTVANILDDLAELGFVTQAGVGTPGSRGGRKPLLVTIDRQRKRVVGGVVDGRTLHLALGDLNGHELKRLAADLDSDNESKKISALVNDLLAEAGSNPQAVVGMVLIGCKKVKFPELEEALGFPVRECRFAEARAFGECWFNHDPFEADFFFVNLDGKVDGLAVRQSIIDHTFGGFPGCYLAPVPYGNEVERRALTLEAALSGHDFLRQAEDTLKSPLTFEQLLTLADAGDERVLELFREYGYNLGCALSLVVNMSCLRKIVLGGPLARGWRHFKETLQKSLKLHMDESLHEAIVVKPIRHDLDNGLSGAMAIALDSWVFNTTALKRGE